MKKTIKTLIIWTLILSVIITITSYLNMYGEKTVNYTEALKNVKSGQVKKIEIESDNNSLKYMKDGNTYRANIPSVNSFLDEIKGEITENKIEVYKKDEPSYKKVLKTAMYIIPTILGLLILFLILNMLAMNGKRQEMAKDITFGKSKARRMDNEEDPEVVFDNVAGIEEEKEELKEIVDFLKNPQKYIDMGARIPKGILLVGRPGTGKTLLAKAVAGEAGVPFFTISGSDFVEMYVGVGAKRVREMFQEAKKNSPCILFIDEIDAVGRQRGAGLGGGHDEREQTLNQLLVEMDGFSKNEGVIVMAATNRPDVLDTALLRAGRFDRQIVVSMPDKNARLEILKVHAKGKKLGADVELEVIAKNTAGFSGADLENVLNESALLAAREEKDYITTKDIEQAMIKVTMGPEKKSRVMSKKERKLVSYHEAGHAVVSYFLPTQDKVHEISIVPRGMAGGYTMYKSGEDKSFLSKKEMEEQLIGLLGGRLAEDIVLVDVSTGASNDIERVTKIAQDMVTKYGMSPVIGTICFKQGQDEVFLGRDIAQHKTFSEETAGNIDREVKLIIDKAYEVGREILTQNIDKLHEVAKVLIDREKITGEEFEAIMKGK